MILVEVYTARDCHMCHEATAIIERVRRDVPFDLREIDLTPGEPYYEEYRDHIPVVHINNVETLRHRITEDMFRTKLRQILADPAGTMT
jgi:hypothetical protein